MLPKPEFLHLLCSAREAAPDTALSKDRSFSEAVLVVVADQKGGGVEDQLLKPRSLDKT